MLKCHLKPMLDARRMAIRQLADKIDYRFESVRMLYNGDLKNKRLPTELIEKLCREFNCTVGELITVEDDEPESDTEKPEAK